jgi:ribosome-associated protein
MDIRKLQRVIVDGLEDVKAQNIVVFNTEHLSPLFERVIVASGTSNRQTKSLAASVRDAVKAAGDPPPRTEGEDNGEWIIVDCGAAVVHVMQPAIRDYYHLEELWGDKPVKMKIASTAPRLVKAAVSHGDGDGVKPAARGAVRRVVPAERPASAATPARRAPAKRAAGTRSAPAKRVVIRTTGVKSTAAKAARTGPRPAAKKAAAKR